MNHNKWLLVIAFVISCVRSYAQVTSWPNINVEAKPATRWWWMGSAVDKENLTRNIKSYAEAGMGTLEITPIYGVQGNDANEIPFLSPQWMEMLRHTQSEAHRNGMQIDMNTGTGWPFGSPEVSLEDAASCLLISEYKLKGGERLRVKVEPEDKTQKAHAVLSRLMGFSDKGICLDLTLKVDNKGMLNWKASKGNWRLIAAFTGKTLQKVKRAAPGGEGYVMDHFSEKSVENYLARFDKAFSNSKVSYPHNFFNDSYEVYKADWTPRFFEEFALRRGYKLEEHLPEFLSEVRSDNTARIISDYRETMAELLQANFTKQWTEWAHSHGAKTRNQAHGSPGNLIDLYATVDVPECEGFGISDFNIKGLRKDSLTRSNDSDLSMLKYASSAAHIAGKPYISSETFTWLTEHFRTSLSQCKPDIDLMFVSGVNHAYFHGCTYSPKEAEWPGWKFYASIDMSPTNSIWKDAPSFFDYISRCQSFLQMGAPDNDFLLYLPIYDMWQEQDGRLLMFDIHKMSQRAPSFIEAVHRIYNAGYDVDYISDNFIRNAQCVDGKIVTSGGISFKALIIPGVKLMPDDVLAKLVKLASEGATLVFLDRFPEDVPGYNALDLRRENFNQCLEKLKSQNKERILFGHDYAETLRQTGVRPEIMKRDWGLSCIRRCNEDGYHYFISALKSDDTEGWIPLGVKAKSALFFDPMTGEQGKAALRNVNGQTEVYMQLSSGSSIILKTFSAYDVDVKAWDYLKTSREEILIEINKFDFCFSISLPEVHGTLKQVQVGTWTNYNLPEVKNTMGTGVYKTTFEINPLSAPEWILDLGDVRESAKVIINNKSVATLWAVPFRCMIGKYLKLGINTIEIEVTNLSANRIADLDRRGKEWRVFKEINMVDRNYNKTGYANWESVPSGLLTPVRLIPMEPITH
ncbi:glycosyl hydrolase [Bacteroides graminisolvens]|uniref:alpha-L-rhamnosidase n=1 Tax=Bacteroides graminisolvens TaxID=477666 RepID=UPI0029C5FD1E|nr:glycosyl hydrolase [Bacteroides graminisolvens]